jgi:hypothetical protein
MTHHFKEDELEQARQVLTLLDRSDELARILLVVEVLPSFVSAHIQGA